MAGSLSDYAENKVLAHSVGKTAWAMPSTVYVALYTQTPTENTNGVEVPTLQATMSTGYARLLTSPSSWSEPSGGELSNAQTFSFGAAATTWGQVEGVAILDAATSGNVIWYGAFSSPRTVVAGEKLIFDPGAFVLSLT